MEQEDSSFWADIKKYEDTLERDPHSYCFAPLSELYRKMGMVDDAITVAKRGCENHPDYIGGYMALGRAYFEKGMNNEAREALERVVRVTPDNLLAQRILSKVYMDAGEVESAEESLKTILTQNPDDSESKILLDSLARTGGVRSQSTAEPEEKLRETGAVETDNSELEFFPGEEPEEIIDLLESDIIEEFAEDIAAEIPLETSKEEALPSYEQPVRGAGDYFADTGIERKDPLTTTTLAELYVSQGFPKKALTIYRELLEADPENLELQNRLFSLKEEIDKDEATARDQSIIKDGFTLEAVESEEVSLAADVVPMGSHVATSTFDEKLATGDRQPASTEEHIIHTFEMMLENIRRRRNGT
jgi:tetratricopeptide (TPR) repeat protein